MIGMEIDESVPLLSLLVTTTFNSFSTERRFPSNLTLTQLKKLLEGLTGGSPLSMQLNLFAKDGSSIGSLESFAQDTQLHAAGVQNGMTLQVTDPTIRIGEYEDVSKVKKFELSEEEYAKRAETLRAFKQQNKLGSSPQQNEEGKVERERKDKELIDKMHVGDRCIVRVQGQPTKKGSVMYKGLTNFKPGYWIGVKYDEPLGKHDGSVDGKRYFECHPKYGAFVRPENVTVGDYPEDDPMSEL